jgi:uncharacterized repeat protein (TIGR02543 family)
MVFCAGLLLFTGCKDLFHPDGPETVYYTVTFNADGGSPSTQTRTVESGDTVGYSNMPSNPARNGYIFEGWYTEQNGNGSLFTYYTTVNSNMTVYAGWTENEYTVTFNADGGNPAIETRTVTNGSSVGSSNMPSDPTREGYTFGGWYTEQNGNGSPFTYSSPVNSDMTVYAKWTISQHTVTFDADGGSPSTQTRGMNSGASLGSSDMPSDPTREGYTFGGWYTEQNGNGSQFTYSSTVNDNMTVYAKWTTATLPSNLSLADALTWISNDAATGNTYTITLRNDETIAPRSLDYSGKTVGITLTGGTAERTISLSTTGSLFTVGNGVTLTLDNNVILQGRNNTASLVQVNSGGTLVMNTGSKISDNIFSSSSPAPHGGGVSVSSGGTFTMSGGTISGNIAYSSYSSYSSSFYSYGGGVYVSGTFSMRGGTISGNTSFFYGGGVSVSNNGIFTKQSGGIIYGSNENNSALRNTATKGNNDGHAVYGGSSAKIRNTTADASTSLNSAVSGSAGGWE